MDLRDAGIWCETDPPSEKVEVLIAKATNHLRVLASKNPRLCDRSAVEKTASDITGTQRRDQIIPANHNEKREADE
jgi:hypothetical protein